MCRYCPDCTALEASKAYIPDCNLTFGHLSRLTYGTLSPFPLPFLLLHAPHSLTKPTEENLPFLKTRSQVPEIINVYLPDYLPFINFITRAVPSPNIAGASCVVFRSVSGKKWRLSGEVCFLFAYLLASLPLPLYFSPLKNFFTLLIVS